MSQTDRDEARRLLAGPLDLTNATVDTEPSQAKIVHSVRLDPALSERLFSEADRRGLTPSALLRDLVEQALTPASDADIMVTVRVVDLHRALDSVIQRAA